ncbi:hypothetical protein BB561_001689 [Smittium simulii]|uniref:DnaJ homolog 1, mitochondrial n=1 Tax=Smittium simulii TaxID=133385 RepID=A0A2T9YTG8_9FUNG|nr:hypothetical protein BB561_001689 [Smittium simulii]
MAFNRPFYQKHFCSSLSKAFQPRFSYNPSILSLSSKPLLGFSNKVYSNPSTQPSFINKREFHSTNFVKADDLYKILGVSKDATTSEIKKKYYQLAKKLHPDVNKSPNSKEEFFKIQEAYDVSGFPGGGYGFSDAYGSGRTAPSMEDIFSQIFGSGFGANASNTSKGSGSFNRGNFSSQGDDINTTINITFAEAISGVEKKIRINPIVECSTCDGNGHKKGAKPKKCASCKGTGRQTFSMGGFMVQQTCSSCGGSGSSISKQDSCNSCSGRGVVQTSETVTVAIPAGVDNGMTVEMRSNGNSPVDGKGPRGSLYVHVKVAESDVYIRQGADIYYDETISLSQALLGGEVTIPTVQGKVDVTIKPGTQPFDELRLRGKGMKKVQSFGHGDFYITVNIAIPKNLSDIQKDLAQKFLDSLDDNQKQDPNNKSSSEKNSAKSKKGLFAKLKDQFSGFQKKKKQ